MTEKRYFQKEYAEEFYIFDSAKISEEKVDMESEYGYEVFSNSMSVDEIVDLLNNQEGTILILKSLNKRQYELLKEWSDLMFARDWDTLEKIVEEIEKQEENILLYGG